MSNRFSNSRNNLKIQHRTQNRTQITSDHPQCLWGHCLPCHVCFCTVDKASTNSLVLWKLGHQGLLGGSLKRPLCTGSILNKRNVPITEFVEKTPSPPRKILHAWTRLKRSLPFLCTISFPFELTEELGSLGSDVILELARKKETEAGTFASEAMKIWESSADCHTCLWEDVCVCVCVCARAHPSMQVWMESETGSWGRWNVRLGREVNKSSSPTQCSSDCGFLKGCCW